MKTKHLILAFFLIFIYKNSFSQLTAEFDFQVSGNQFLNVAFTDFSTSSETINTWQWDFGDGNTSSEQNPFHEYLVEGTYQVVLATTTASYTDSIIHFVSVGDNYYQGEECFASFSFQKIGDNYLEFQFFDESYTPNGRISTYFWNFGDGTSSSEENPVKLYNTEGEYEVSLTITGTECTNTFTSLVFATANNWYPNECQALFWFNTNPANHKEFNFFDFSYGNGEILSWHWNFGDGSISELQNPIYEFATNGTYETSLTIINENCENTFYLDLIVTNTNSQEDSLIPLFYPEIDGNFVNFHNISRGNAESWHWNFGDGNIETMASPSHTFDEDGIHEVALSAYKGDKVNTIVIQFTTSANKNSKLHKGIDHAYFHPGGISKIETIKTLSFSVFPNPANNYLSIKTKSKNATIQIYDITGKICIEKTIGSKINIKKLNSGLYLIKVTDNDISGTIKFIKK